MKAHDCNPALPCALCGRGMGEPAPAAAAAECRFADPLAGAERAARNLSHGPRWVDCRHPAQPLGAVVCPCQGCGPGCTGFKERD